MNKPDLRNDVLPVDWDREEIISKSNRFYAASQQAFVPYQKPLILKRGLGQ